MKTFRRGLSRVDRPTKHRLACLVLVAVGALADGPVAASTPETALEELHRLDLEQLMKVRVTSAAKKAQPLAEAPAAIHVMTAEDIVRSGALSLPELLRTVPGLHVAQIDSHQWAISARGFNGLFANKLLVLIDGRSVYTPIFAGVYWDAQDTALEDVERIEVIRGPGATLWGANAVNGVINVTTREASQSVGGRVTLGGGSEDRAFASFRYGGDLGGSDYRVYGKAFLRDATRRASDRDKDNFDEWNFAQAGFRVDRSTSGASGRLTVQGDAYDGELDQEVLVPVPVPPFGEARQRKSTLSGVNVLGRWRRDFEGDVELMLQGYFDRVLRNDTLFDLEQDTGDLELQLRLQGSRRHDLVTGLGYRRISDRLRPGIVVMDPRARSYEIVTGFVQDEISMAAGRLSLVLGAKIEHNDFNGFELQPGARFLWSFSDQQSLWGSISRSVRSSSRSEHDATAAAAAFAAPDGTPIVARLVGNRDQDSEKLLAYELGYRLFPSNGFWLDVSAFYNDYQDLRTFEPGVPSLGGSETVPYLVLPLVVDDLAAGQSWGVEIAASAKTAGGWRFQLGYSFIDLDVRGEPGSLDPATAAIAGETPRHQVSLRFDKKLPKGFDFGGMWRWVDEIPSLAIDAYAELDLRLARRVGRVELSLVGRNLLEASHSEYLATIIASPRAEVERSIRAQLTWHF